MKRAQSDKLFEWQLFGRNHSFFVKLPVNRFTNIVLHAVQIALASPHPEGELERVVIYLGHSGKRLGVLEDVRMIISDCQHQLLHLRYRCRNPRCYDLSEAIIELQLAKSRGKRPVGM